MRTNTYQLRLVSIVVLLATSSNPLANACQMEFGQLDAKVQELVAANDALTSRYDVAYFEIESRQTRSFTRHRLWTDLQMRRWTEDFWMADSRSELYLEGESLPFESHTDLIRDLKTAICRSFRLPNPSLFDQLTPCDQKRASAGMAPWPNDYELKALGRLLVRVPVGVFQSATLRQLTENYATSISLKSREEAAGHPCRRLTIDATFGECGLPAEPIQVSIWLDESNSGFIRQVEVRDEYGSRVHRVTEVEEIDESPIARKVEQFWVEGQHEKHIETNTLTRVVLEPDRRPHWDDPDLGFRFPKYMKVVVADVPIDSIPLGDGKKHLERIILGEDGKEVLLRTRENAIWLDQWCRDHGFPGNPGRIMPFMSTEAGMDDASQFISRTRDVVGWFIPLIFLTGAMVWLRNRRNRIGRQCGK